ncbi:hypothetical protein F4859DRAFT_374642 [Xylaria cf. heliscus]|nr:hypothetical protein F4859DRAFT_374642 [Xylaria cf. heliscus]
MGLWDCVGFVWCLCSSLPCESFCDGKEMHRMRRNSEAKMRQSNTLNRCQSIDTRYARRGEVQLGNFPNSRMPVVAIGWQRASPALGMRLLPLHV